MHVLVVFAHPDAESFGAAVRDAACAGLERAGHVVDLLDLEAVDYDPCLSADELEQYEDLADHHPDPVVRDHIARLRRADALVFVYPTFWSGLPAVLKGWLDRTMLPGVAFRLAEHGPIRPALTHVDRIVAVTTYGSPRRYRWFVGDAGLRTLWTLRLNCGLRCRFRWLSLDRLDGRTATDRIAFLERVETRMAALR